MKKILLSAAAALLALGASAQTAQEDVRIYINPGHGSWTSNDRPCGTVKHGNNNPSATGSDTAGFFESNTNLLKGFAMLEKLVEYGVPFDRTKNQDNSNPARQGAALDLSQNIVMSHVKAGPYPTVLMGGDADLANAYNRNLSEISAEVEFNNFDVFVSIHSNALTDGTNTNFPLILYRGTDAQEGNAGSIAIGKAVWPHLFGLGHQQWTSYSATNINVRGDMTFYDKQSSVSYDVTDPDYEFDSSDKFVEYDEDANKVTYTGHLGVIKHGVPGFLAEGYFHTYQPARHRYMNDEVCYLEGEAYAKGLNDYFGWGKTESTGTIYGVVRDKNNKYTHTYYTPNGTSNDAYKPLNDVEVTLKDSEGNVVATYKTDDEYNGVFVFKNLEPGEYTAEFSHPEYKKDVYADIKVASQPAPFAISVKAATIVYPEAFLVDTAWVAPSVVYENYPDPLADSEFTLADAYELEGNALNALASQLSGKTVRRTVLHDGLLYVLAIDADKNPSLLVLDTDDNSIKATVSTAGCEGTHLNLSDIQVTADGYLIGCSKEWNQYSSAEVYTTGDANHTKYGYGDVRGECWIYKWEKDGNGIPTGNPIKWVSTKGTGNWYRAIVGETFAWSGTTDDGMAILSAQTATATGIRTQLITVTADANGNPVTTESFHQPYLDGAAASTLASSLGETYNYVTSPLNDNNYIVVSAGDAPIYECNFNHKDKTNQLSKLSTDVVAANVPNVSFFKYAGKSLMVAPNINADGKVQSIKLIDITGGFTSTKQITLTGASIDALAFSYASAHGGLNLAIDDDEITDANVELYLVVDGTVYKFTEPVATPEPEEFVTVTPAAGTANPFAYALKSEVDETTLKINYSLNADAEDVTIVIKDENGVEYEVIEQGAKSKGAQTAEIALTDYDAGNYDWEIVVDGAEKNNVEEFKSYRFYHPRGVDVDNNMESVSFGNVYVTEGISTTSSTYWSGTRGGIGLYAFSADMDPIKNPATDNYVFTGGWTLNQKIGTVNGADLARVRVADDGRIFVTRMSGDGNYIMYAPSFEDLYANNTFTSLFDGLTLDAATYKYTNANGTFMAAANVGFDVKGSGEDLKMVALSANANLWGYAYSGGSTDEYALGTATNLPVPTNVPALTGKYTIAPNTTNVDYDDRGGIWYCQYRSTPIDAQPGLVYIDAEGKEKYKDLVSRGGGGVRVSPDGTKIAIASSGADPQQFTIYGLTCSDAGVPTLRREYVITHGIGTNVYDIAWDLAGNIYICGNTGEYLKGFSLPRTESFTTKAASKYSFSVVANSIDAISVDNENALVEYYNLQGVKVEKPANGIFIKVQGKKTEKVYIK